MCLIFIHRPLAEDNQPHFSVIDGWRHWLLEYKCFNSIVTFKGVWEGTHFLTSGCHDQIRSRPTCLVTSMIGMTLDILWIFTQHVYSSIGIKKIKLTLLPKGRPGCRDQARITYALKSEARRRQPTSQERKCNCSTQASYDRAFLNHIWTTLPFSLKFWYCISPTDSRSTVQTGTLSDWLSNQFGDRG